MENYHKGKNVVEVLDRSKVPFKDLPSGFLWMQVKGGSSMSNLLAYAGHALEDRTVRTVVWTGAGASVGKTISCIEMFKKQFIFPYQVTRLTYKVDEEHWDPRIDGLETLVVKRHIPVIHVLLSIDEIVDTNQLGYQTKESKKFWQAENTAPGANTVSGRNAASSRNTAPGEDTAAGSNKKPNQYNKYKKNQKKKIRQ